MLPRPCLRTPRRCSCLAPPRAPTTPRPPLALPRLTPWYLEVPKHSVLFFARIVHRFEVTEDGTVDKGEATNFALSGVAPPPPMSGQPRFGT